MFLYRNKSTYMHMHIRIYQVHLNKKIYTTLIYVHKKLHVMYDDLI